jgi:FRG domain
MRTVNDFWHDFHMHAARAAQPGMPVLFRGEPESGFPLIPSIARGTKDGTFSDVSSLEDTLLREFRLAAAPIMDVEPTNEIDWVFLAQHYGVPTRLLDWSTNPMVALFFAVEAHDEKEGVIYVADHQVTDQVELVDFRTASVTKDKQQGALRIFALQNGQGKVMFVRPKYTDEPIRDFVCEA